VLTSSQIFVGLGLTFGLAVACQITASRLRIPAIILLLPAGFLAGAATTTVDPDKIFGSSFSPLVSVAVAIILFDGGQELRFRELEGHHRRVAERLVGFGVPLTGAGAGLFASLLLGLSPKAAAMLGAILIVSGPTVLAPILDQARPRRHLRSILWWEGSVVDPVGAIIGVLTYQAIVSGFWDRPGEEVLRFLANIGIGLIGGVGGAFVLWVLSKLKLSDLLATLAILATVVVVAALCNAYRDETGLLAAIIMGVAMGNLPGMDRTEHKPFFQTVVQLTIGLLFISISATVTPASLKGIVVATIGLVACLVLIVRPVVAVLATVRSRLSLRERTFIGMMDPRGIVAASTAATFAAPLVRAHVGGANKLLATTFLVIMLTVLLYGLSAAPIVKALDLRVEPEEDDRSSGVSHQHLPGEAPEERGEDGNDRAGIQDSVPTPIPRIGHAREEDEHGLA
jgi:NhaP-type Na+/H+ or K+/H+ antiporter